MLIETLQRTLEILKQGWCKDKYTDGKGAYCLSGALNEAVGSEWVRACWDRRRLIPRWTSFESSDQIREAVELLEPIIGRPIPTFNDDPNTTHQDVLNVVEKALAEAGGMC